MMIRKTIIAAGLALFASFALGACQPEVITETIIEEVEVIKEIEVEVIKEADPGKLVIYSGRSEALVEPLIAQFEAATGIDVEVHYGSSTEMASIILQEWGNSKADLFYAQDPGSLGAISEAELLSQLPDNIMAQVPPRFQGPKGDWVGISGRARVVVYNTNAVNAEDLPDTLEGFTDPKWNGRIGWPPTNSSFQAMITAMRETWGDEKTRDWLKGIQANNPVVYAKNTPTVEAVGTGIVEVGFVNHYYLYQFIDEQGDGFPAQNHFLNGGGPGSLIMVSGTGILKSSQNKENAEKFLNFMLSVPGQQYFASQTLEYPVVDGIRLEDSLIPLSELDTTAINLPLSAMADLEGTHQMLLDLGIILDEDS